MLITLLLFFAAAADAEALKAEQPAKPSKEERESLYTENSMEYAKALYLENDGSAADEDRSRKGDTLNFAIRKRGIEKLEERLALAKEKRIRREILHRLSQLYEQQAEVTGRRSDVKDKTAMIHSALRASVRYLEILRKEYPHWIPDAVIFNLAENHSKLQEDKQAEKYYREVISSYPKSAVVADSLLSLGNLYFERQLFEAARVFYGKILSTPEETLHPYAHYKIAWCYFNESEMPEAVAALDRSILESRRISQSKAKKLGVEEEALSDLVLFYAEYGNPGEAKEHLERLAGKERAAELRYSLARKLFDDGKHLLAMATAKQLLEEKPKGEIVNKLYLIMISVAERLKDRETGLATAEKLSKWMSAEKLAKTDAAHVEAEEYLRHYSQKLHYEAETMKQGSVWAQARKSYEIYLSAFPEEAETPEMKFRFAVLLMNRKESLNAYKYVSEVIAKIDQKHPRYQEALRLRLQAIELTGKEERKQIPESEVLAAYDAYATHFPKEELGIEASYKAALAAKTLESPESAALRFQALAEAHPEHKLAKPSVEEALAVLVKAQKWEALEKESKALAEHPHGVAGALGADDSLKKKISEALELSHVKLTETLEQNGQLDEAKKQYERALAENPSETLGIYSYIRLATLAEQKQNRFVEAIKYYEGLRQRYPSVKESRQALLELARLFDKVNQPREAAKRFLAYGHSGKGKLENQALTNGAALLESLGAREEASAELFRLAENLGSSKDAAAAFEAGCNDILLASHQNHEKKILQQIHDCARELSGSSAQPLLWQARSAWALDQMAENLQADKNWKKIAQRSLKGTAETDRAYLAMAKLKMLENELTQFKVLRFSRANQKPEANIGKKTKAMEELEKKAENLIKIATPKQILAVRNVLRLANIEFAETMEAAALPKGLSDAESAELKKSFQTFASGFREKAASFAEKDGADRAPASLAEAKAEDLKIGSLSAEEAHWIAEGQVPAAQAVAVYAKKAVALFKEGRWGEARYFSEKWKKESAAAGAAAETQKLEQFQAMLAGKLPELDPMSREFQ